MMGIDFRRQRELYLRCERRPIDPDECCGTLSVAFMQCSRIWHRCGPGGDDQCRCSENQPSTPSRRVVPTRVVVSRI